MAAQSTTVASMYPAATETARDEAIAIIPQMSSWQELTDEALIARYREEAGQAQAEQYLNELFRRHHTKVARWCLSVTGDRESAADLAQEICVKAYQNLATLKANPSFLRGFIPLPAIIALTQSGPERAPRKWILMSW